MAFYIKPFTSCELPLKIKNIDHSKIKSIDFIFKKNKSFTTSPIIKKTYGSSGDGSVTKKDDTYTIKLNANETGNFPRDTVDITVYLDIRPVLTDSTVPIAKIVPITVVPSLYAESELSNG